MPWWDRQIHADRRPLLLLRGRIKTGLRAWFEAEGFIEVECGMLAASPGNEAHLHAFSTNRIRADGTIETLYLHTSPEFAAKKLLAAGETRIFEFARVFRNRERTRLHAPEFTMLEWYRAGAAVGQVMEDTLTLARRAADIAGAKSLRYRDRKCDPFAEAETAHGGRGLSRSCRDRASGHAGRARAWAIATCLPRARGGRDFR